MEFLLGISLKIQLDGCRTDASSISVNSNKIQFHNKSTGLE
jgi:hypothetical protein